MKRRSFLVGVGVSVVSTAWPAWLRRAFADASVVTHGNSPSLAATQARAHQSGKPIFAIIVPDDDDGKSVRGQLWGEYLNHAENVQLAPLALAEVVCARLRDLPSSAKISDDTLAMVIEPDGEARPLATRLPHEPASPKDYEYEAFARQRIAAVARMVQRGLGADDKMLARRAADARRALGTDAEKIDRALAESSISPSLADRGAALLMRSSTHRELLASTVKARLRVAPPPGAHWANRSACAVDTVEDMPETETIGIGCGMGRIPDISRRFLYFYTQTPGQRIAAEMHEREDPKKTKR